MTVKSSPAPIVLFCVLALVGWTSVVAGLPKPPRMSESMEEAKRVRRPSEPAGTPWDARGETNDNLQTTSGVLQFKPGQDRNEELNPDLVAVPVAKVGPAPRPGA